VNISSPNRKEFYPTPEFRNLLEATESLRTEVSRFGEKVKDRVAYKRLLKNMDALEESLQLHFEGLQVVEKTLIATALDRLTEKQRAMLRWMAERYVEETVYTRLIERLSEELEIPKSTVRWNLHGLRESGIIRAGDKDNKGVPVRLTERGLMLTGYLATGIGARKRI